jgi:hypothetical protein
MTRTELAASRRHGERSAVAVSSRSSEMPASAAPSSVTQRSARRWLSRRGPPRPSSASGLHALSRPTRDREAAAGCFIGAASAPPATSDHAGSRSGHLSAASGLRARRGPTPPSATALAFSITRRCRSASELCRSFASASIVRARRRARSSPVRAPRSETDARPPRPWAGTARPRAPCAKPRRRAQPRRSSEQCAEAGPGGRGRPR